MPDLSVLIGAGTRVRAGNTMGRTRAALLDAALTAITKHGARKATMGDVAMIANVAKGTLYNHFRSKDELYAAAARGAVVDLGERAALVAAESGLGAGLAVCAEAIATSAVLARLRADEPGVLGLALAAAVTDESCTAVSSVLVAGGLVTDGVAVETVLRWLLGYAAGGADLAVLPAVADRLAAALSAASVAVAPALPATDITSEVEAAEPMHVLGSVTLPAPAGETVSV